jgi:hypothetical protein
MRTAALRVFALKLRYNYLTAGVEIQVVLTAKSVFYPMLAEAVFSITLLSRLRIFAGEFFSSLRRRQPSPLLIIFQRVWQATAFLLLRRRHVAGWLRLNPQADKPFLTC